MSKLFWLLAILITFCGALLGFALQPMIGRLLLPNVGGAPAAWLVILAFFQLAYLAGYGVVHAAQKAGAVFLAFMLPTLLLLGAAFFAPDFTTNLTDPQNLLQALVVAVGLPAMALATIVASVQHIISRSTHEAASNPYQLYVISNIGSFAGLFGYPLVVEWVWDLPAQQALWHAALWALGGLSLLFALCFLSHRAAPVGAVTIPAPAPASADIDWQQKIYWVANAALSTALVGAVTLAIGNEIASFPLMWVAPLGLFLISFIWAFAASRAPNPLTVNLAAGFLTMVVVLLWLFLRLAQGNSASTMLVALWLLTFFVVCLMLQLNLARTRPAPAQLTLFYFCIALGGALGGLFSAFAAPFIFISGLEFYWLLAAALGLSMLATSLEKRMAVYCAGAAGTAFMALIMLYWFGPLNIMWALPPMIILTVCGVLLLLQRYGSAALVGVAVMLGTFIIVPDHIIDQQRNFFGVHTVREDVTQRTMLHGTTLHGAEPHDEALKGKPLAYYAWTSPIGEVIKTQSPQEILVIGLGTGQMACYAAPNERRVSFIEIDPLIVKLAQQHFSYFARCGTPPILLGDGRLVLKANPATYDLIVLDAFSSDAIPVHLLTQQAIQLYQQRLKPGGVMALHVSNRHINLVPPLARVAESVGLPAWFKADSDQTEKFKLPSIWVIITANQALPADLLNSYAGWRQAEPKGRLWTDAYTNILPHMFVLGAENYRQPAE